MWGAACVISSLTDMSLLCLILICSVFLHCTLLEIIQNFWIAERVGQKYDRYDNLVRNEIFWKSYKKRKHFQNDWVDRLMEFHNNLWLSCSQGNCFSITKILWTSILPVYHLFFDPVWKYIYLWAVYPLVHSLFHLFIYTLPSLLGILACFNRQHNKKKGSEFDSSNILWSAS